ncbi:putative ras-responsive element-binding protein 1 [Apostichopus japonicus]|uniref:Putative ras-responsive element-binding protein 1 n=1 Tax=Stichopus japonicus TaxID=307972 RepID=A0A2G8LFL1_STIJA|nr:putative ras-responsive element-binding protein 1 [Apostichopus japonicus]
MDKEPGSLPSDEAFSDRNISEDDGCENSDSDSHVSTAAGDGQMMLSMVGDLSGAASLVIPQVTLSGKKGKKGARFSCDQCCKKFKSELTLCRHLKVHQLEHPFNCTECSATFTTKFNCQRHIMKLHGKRKEDVMSITGVGRCQNLVFRKHLHPAVILLNKLRLTQALHRYCFHIPRMLVWHLQ